VKEPTFSVVRPVPTACAWRCRNTQ